jgi:diphthamide biosynthesis methyltransferase
VFDTTHHAIWAEEVAEERGIPVEVVPAPAEAKASCGLALRVHGTRVDLLAAALGEEGVEYRIHRPGS